MSGDNVTGLLRAEKFPEGHPLQPRHRWIARVPGLPGSSFIAASLRPDDCGEPPWEPARCGWERRPHAWDSRGAARLRSPGRPWLFLCPRLSPFMPIKKKYLLQ